MIDVVGVRHRFVSAASYLIEHLLYADLWYVTLDMLRTPA
jgi:hypothetical protein